MQERMSRDNEPGSSSDTGHELWRRQKKVEWISYLRAAGWQEQS